LYTRLTILDVQLQDGAMRWEDKSTQFLLPERRDHQEPFYLF
jgi:hypothetical protein